MDFKQTIQAQGREDRFLATVYAMNTLLIQKGIYTTEEFEAYFCQWQEHQERIRALKKLREID